MKKSTSYFRYNSYKRSVQTDIRFEGGCLAGWVGGMVSGYESLTILACSSRQLWVIYILRSLVSLTSWHCDFVGGTRWLPPGVSFLSAFISFIPSAQSPSCDPHITSCSLPSEQISYLEGNLHNARTNYRSYDLYA